MIYSIIPDSLIYNGFIDNSIYKFDEIEYNGQKVIARHINEQVFVERIISSNPKDFMNNSLQPGTEIMHFKH